jgi:hypothetical protein
MTVPKFSRAVAGHTSVTRPADPVLANGHERGKTDTVDDDGVLECTAMECRADVDNLDALQAKRRALVKQFAPLAAQFKGGTTAGSDSARKRHRAGIAKLILQEQFKDASKQPAENALERMANADSRHIDFCEDLEKRFAKYVVLENDIADVTEQIRNREECLRVYRAELGLA